LNETSPFAPNAESNTLYVIARMQVTRAALATFSVRAETIEARRVTLCVSPSPLYLFHSLFSFVHLHTTLYYFIHEYKYIRSQCRCFFIVRCLFSVRIVVFRSEPMSERLIFQSWLLEHYANWHFAPSMGAH
jgi:hypothetical protein